MMYAYQCGLAGVLLGGDELGWREYKEIIKKLLWCRRDFKIE